MRFRRSQPSFGLRLMALATLVCWLAALTTSMACGPVVESDAKNEIAAKCCPADTCGQQCHNEADSSSPPLCPANDASCVTLKTAMFSGAAQALPTPAFQLLYLSAVILPPLDAGLDSVVASVFRHVRLRDWTFTPEVCLGPACRSHAPPVLV